MLHSFQNSLCCIHFREFYCKDNIVLNVAFISEHVKFIIEYFSCIHYRVSCILYKDVSCLHCSDYRECNAAFIV